MDNYERAFAIKEEIIGHRRTLHQIPEIGLDLPQTVAYVKACLTEMGYEPQDVGGGVVVTVGKPGKTILLRADMDALPMREESGLSIAATNGNCHACGHDIHTAMLLGAAKLLKAQEAALQGTVKLMFQPGEESAGGAKKMLEAGVLDNPKVDCAVMLHVYSNRDAGVAVQIGTKCASSDDICIRVYGKGGHAARPYEGVDAVYIAAQIVIGLQELLTRELAYDQQAVLSLCHIEGGHAKNVLPDSVLIEGTLRTFDPEVQKLVKHRISEIAQGIAQTYRGRAEVDRTPGTPVLVNEVAFSTELKRYVEEFSQGRFPIQPGWVSSGSEDFAHVASEVPGCAIGLSIPVSDTEKQYPLHNPKVLFEEKNIPVGTAVYAECAMRWLEEHC